MTTATEAPEDQIAYSTNQVAELLACPPRQVEVLAALAGIARSKVGNLKAFDAAGLRAIREAHEAYRAALAIPPDRRPALRALFAGFAAEVRALAG